MKYIDINRRLTEIVSGFLSGGYIINSVSMGGGQGETCKIDLTNGTEIIRVLVDTFFDLENNLEGVEIVVGKATDADVRPHSNSGWHTIWNNRLDIITTERFYKIGEDRRHGAFYGGMVEAKAVAVIRRSRYFARESSTRRTEDVTDKAMEIAKRIIRREFKVKRICDADIVVRKRTDGGYIVEYRGKTYRPH